MNIIEALVQLRNDLKTWVANNLRVKLDKNLGAEESGKVLSIDSEGNVITSTMPLIATVPAGWMRGDVDHDGFVTSNDADLILKYAVSTV